MNQIIKIKDLYLEYSGFRGTPLTTGETKDMLENYLMEKFGWINENNIKHAFYVADQGTFDYNFEKQNTAGKDGANLTLDEIYQVYCDEKPLNGWLPDWIKKGEGCTL